jgi:prepilin-type N-terminal cleavage/methylation domain-containing protein
VDHFFREKYKNTRIQNYWKNNNLWENSLLIVRIRSFLWKEVIIMVKFLLSLYQKRPYLIKNNGFTLIEVLAVLVILSILVAIAVPSYVSYIEKAEKEVCYANSFELERMYHGYLHLEGVDHSDPRFNQYMQEFFGEISPSGGEINYLDGDVSYGLHPRDNDSAEDEGDDDGSVPFL